MIEYMIPKTYGEDEEFHVMAGGWHWNRVRRRWEEAMDLSSPSSYRKLGHAKRGAEIAATNAAGRGTVTIVGSTMLEEYLETVS